MLKLGRPSCLAVMNREKGDCKERTEGKKKH